MKVFVQHLGTPSVKAHDVGVFSLAEAVRRFAGLNERGWPTLDETWLVQLCREGGRYAHFHFTPVAP